MSYYNVLGLDRSASDLEVKQAYRKLAIKWLPHLLCCFKLCSIAIRHPTKNNNSDPARAKFRELAEALEVLSDRKNKTQFFFGGSPSLLQPINALFLTSLAKKVSKPASPTGRMVFIIHTQTLASTLKILLGFSGAWSFAGDADSVFQKFIGSDNPFVFFLNLNFYFCDASPSVLSGLVIFSLVFDTSSSFDIFVWC